MHECKPTTGEDLKEQNPQLSLVERLTVADDRDERISKLEDDNKAIKAECE